MKKSFLSVVLVGLVIAACSSEEADPAAIDSSAAQVTIDGNTFVPAEVTIKVGQTVRWTFGSGAHNVLSGPECTGDGKFGAGDESTPATGTYEFKFDQAGDFPYFCSFHCSMNMKGIVPRHAVIGRLFALASPLLIAAACGGDDPPPPATGAALNEPCEADNDCQTRYCDLEKRLCSALADVDAIGNGFSPADITVRVGEIVRWHFRGGEHNVVSGEGCEGDDKFRSGAPQRSGTYVRRFDVEGEFPYFCETHCDDGMTGIVRVVP